MSFGLMGGRMQAQGHLQMLLRVLRYRQNPQAAADAPRWRVVKGRSVAVEPEMGADSMNALKDRGHDISIEPADAFGFGGAQLILKGEDGTYVSGSDPRKDGQAVVF
jgi:gamma-glutamyltranspeptidase/glutathione hydrolase